MGKRVNVQRTEKERIALLKQWKERSEWSLEEAARQLRVSPQTLRDWKKRYWENLDSITGSDRTRRKGAGPSRKMRPYEGIVLRYFHVCLREKGVCRFSELLVYCRQLEEFQQDIPNRHSQETWVERFIKYYSSRVHGSGDSAEIQGEDGNCLAADTDVLGGGGTSSSGGGTRSSGGGTSSGDSDFISGGDGNIGGNNIAADDLVIGEDNIMGDGVIIGEDSNSCGGVNCGGSNISGSDVAITGDIATPDGSTNFTASGTLSNVGGASWIAGGTYHDAASDGGGVSPRISDASVGEPCVNGAAYRNISGGDGNNFGGKTIPDSGCDVLGSSGAIASDDDSIFSSPDGNSVSSSDTDDSEESLFKADLPIAKTDENVHQTAGQRFFRKRYSKTATVLEWRNDKTYICIFPDDLKSILPGGWLTETAVDYYIHRYIKSEPGSVFVCGTSTYKTIDLARTSTVAVKRAARMEQLTGLVEWANYPFVLVPITGNDHWSFVAVTNALQNGTAGLYHVNSMKDYHDTAYAFEAVKLVIAKERFKRDDYLRRCDWSHGVFNTKPQQRNTVDCGIFMLYYMEEVAKCIVKEKDMFSSKPILIKSKLKAWTTNGFNAKEARKFRQEYYRRIEEASEESYKRYKSS